MPLLTTLVAEIVSEGRSPRKNKDAVVIGLEAEPASICPRFELPKLAARCAVPVPDGCVLKRNPESQDIVPRLVKTSTSEKSRACARLSNDMLPKAPSLFVATEFREISKIPLFS